MRGAALSTLVAIKLVVNTAFRFVYPFLPAISRGLGINLNQAGVLLSIRWGTSMIAPALMTVSPAIRRSRRLLVTGVLIFTTGAVVTAWSGIYVGAIAGFALLGLAKPMVDISAQVYVSSRVPYQGRARYIGILELAWAGGLLIGAPFAGWLIDNWSWETPFWVLGSLAMLGAGTAMFVLAGHDGRVTERGPAASDVARSQVGLFLAAITMIGFAHETVFLVLGTWLEGSFGLTLLALGGVGTLIGLSELAGEGAMTAFTDRLGKKNSMALGMLIGGLALVVLSVVSSEFAPSMIALAVATFGIEFGYIAGIPMATEMRPHHRARILGLFYIATSGGRIVADLIAPQIFNEGGMAASGVTAAIAIGIALVLLLKVKELGTTPAELASPAH